MSKGNANKRKGTAAELQLWKLLQKEDPEGQWESRTRLPDGTRRPSPPTHGFDLWSDVRATFIECKIRNRTITPMQIEEWCDAAICRDMPPDEDSYRCRVAYRTSGSPYWMIAWLMTRRMLDDRMMLITSFEFWLKDLLSENA